MDKLLLFPGKTDRGIFTYLIDTELDHLVKTAAEYHPEIASYISGAKKIEGKTQILLTALGAGEWWGDNVNGDFFPEEALRHLGQDYGHKTFETHAKIYKHHVNKDPTASYGEVALSVYNDRYHRVELIVVLDDSKAPDIAGRINSGDYPDWSMGCKVPFDVCSICGNRAPTRAQYCEHLKYYMGRIHPPTGKKAYAINTMPKFFDISQVLIGADRIAKTLRKVASIQNAKVAPSSALIAEKMAAHKKAEIEKEVPATPPASQDAINTLVNAIPEVKAKEPVLPRELLDRLGSHKLQDVMSTLAMLGILPKPQEFQRIMLISVGKRDIADDLDSKNMCFDPAFCPEPYPVHERVLGLDGNRFRPEIMDMMMPHMASRSYALPHLAKRIIIMVKNGEEQPLPKFIKLSEKDKRTPLGIMPLMLLAAGLYAAFGKKAPAQAVGKLDKLIAENPKLLLALTAGAASLPMVFNQVAGEKVRGQFDAAGVPENPDISNILKRVEEQKQKPYLKIAGVISGIGPASKRLLLGIPLVYMTSGILQKHQDANPYEQRGRAYNFIRKYPDVIRAGLALDAMLALQGKGTHGLLKHVVKSASATPHKAGSYWQRGFELARQAFSGTELKTASAQDFMMNSLVWPLAFGGKGLPGRVVGGLFDQAVLEGSKKVLSNKDTKSKLKEAERR
jgi:hypothetical protein